MINKKSKRGISSIIGTLLMVAVVSVIGSVILFQGLNGINDFNYYLSFLTGSKDSVHENAIIEHVRFSPATSDLDVWIRNTGTVQIEITKITIVDMDSQVLVLPDTDPNTIISISQLEPIYESVDFNGSVAGTPVVEDISAYDSNPFTSHQYRISVTTSLGNSFETTVSPYNS